MVGSRSVASIYRLDCRSDRGSSNARIRYHVFYTDLRTATYAFSRREMDRTEYWLAHRSDAPQLLGAVDGLARIAFAGYPGSRYGYEGDTRNFVLDIAENRLVDRNGTIEPFGNWPKVNPILGRYETASIAPSGIDVYPSISPPPTAFGIDVAVDGSVLASGVLPNGTTFNYHSKVDLETALGGMALSGLTLLPIGVR